MLIAAHRNLSFHCGPQFPNWTACEHRYQVVAVEAPRPEIGSDVIHLCAREVAPIDKTCGVAFCRFCELPGEPLCSDCRRRATDQAAPLDTLVGRQRVLDLKLGEVEGADLFLSYIAPARTHFDLGYVLVGPYREIGDGMSIGNSQPRLHGPWNATDSDGRRYRGSGAGGVFGPNHARATIRFLPETPTEVSPLLPSSGALVVEALNAGGVVLRQLITVPSPAAYETD